MTEIKIDKSRIMESVYSMSNLITEVEVLEKKGTSKEIIENKQNNVMILAGFTQDQNGIWKK